MSLGASILNLFEPSQFLLIIGGVLMGIAVGILPGITAGMLLALVLPFTYYMTDTGSVIMLVSMFVGGASGGLITATLMRIPGEPNAVMTCLDGFPLAKSGKPGRALGLGNTASIVGGVLSWVALVTLAPVLAKYAIMLGPWEMFAMVIMALVLVSSLSGGSFLKGLISCLLGMMATMPGIDETSGIPRLDFGFESLDSGFDSLPVIIGIFALSQLAADIMNIEQQEAERVPADMRGIMISLRDYIIHGKNMLRSSVIGVWIGLLPGMGSALASVVAYTTAKNLSKTPEMFGKGSEEAIIAAESANNATTGATLIPLLALGIPGGLADAILLGALTIHNLQPGPMMMVNNPGIVHTIMATHLIAHFVMFTFMTVGVALFARLTDIHRAWIFPLVLVFCVEGAYGLNNMVFDVWVMLAFGAVGFALEYAKAPLAPFVIGLMLAPMAEVQLRSGLMASDGSMAPLFERPLAITFLFIAAVLFIWPLWREWRRKSLARAGAQAITDVSE